MRRVKLDIARVSAGMKLAEPIVNSAGMTLMPAGIRLTPMFIIRLKKWNIESIDVFVDEPQEKPEPSPTTPTRAVARSAGGAPPTAEQESFARSVAEEVARCFVNVKDNPLMLQLRNIAIKRLVMHGHEGMLNVMRRRRLTVAEEKA